MRCFQLVPLPISMIPSGEGLETYCPSTTGVLIIFIVAVKINCCTFSFQIFVVLVENMISSFFLCLLTLRKCSCSTCYTCSKVFFGGLVFVHVGHFVNIYLISRSGLVYKSFSSSILILLWNLIIQGFFLSMGVDFCWRRRAIVLLE